MNNKLKNELLVEALKSLRYKKIQEALRIINAESIDFERAKDKISKFNKLDNEIATIEQELTNLGYEVNVTNSKFTSEDIPF